MTNEEFAIGLLQSIDEITNWSYPKTSYISRIKNYLAKNNLQVINSKEELVAITLNDIEDQYALYIQNNPNVKAPEKLTELQAKWILNEADSINSKYDLYYEECDIQLAIENWLEQECHDYDS
jgi:hypothetical protein